MARWRVAPRGPARSRARPGWPVYALQPRVNRPRHSSGDRGAVGRRRLLRGTRCRGRTHDFIAGRWPMVWCATCWT